MDEASTRKQCYGYLESVKSSCVSSRLAVCEQLWEARGALMMAELTRHSCSPCT